MKGPISFKNFLFIPVLILVVLSLAHTAKLSSDFDLANLRSQNTLFTKAYDIINLQTAWEEIQRLNPSLSNIKIGIIDSGVDAQHPEFIGMLADPNIIGAIDFGNTPISAKRDSALGGHGTQVLGIIGANNLSGLNISLPSDSPQMNGILSGAMPLLKYTLEVSKPLRFPEALLFDVFKNYFVDSRLLNTNIINLSLSFVKRSALTPEQRAVIEGQVDFLNFFKITSIYRLVFNFVPNALFVVAAGNENVDVSNETPANLGNMSNVITVAATDLNDERAKFNTLEESSFGNDVNISAPGKNVYAPKPGGDYDKPQKINGIVVGGFSGTSASAPMVTGVAGLIKAIKLDLTPAEIKDILIRNADPIQTGEPSKRIGTGCYSNPNDPLNTGCRLNALNAVCDPLVGLNCAPPPPPPSPQVSPWPMLQKNAQRTGLADVAGPAFATSSAVTLKWQKDLSIASNFPPLIGAQAIYIGAGNNLLAIDKTNGNQIWQANIHAGAASGAIGPDGTIYVCGLNTSQQSVLTAVNSADGSIKWQFIVGSSRPCNDPAVAENGVIFTTVPPPINTQIAVIVAVNSDGTEKWRHEEGNFLTTPPALSNDESQVYVGFRDNLKAFNTQDGQLLWNKSVPIFPLLIAVDSQDRVLNQTLNGPIIAFSKAGAFLWQSGNASAMSLYLENKIFTVNPSGYTFLNASDGSFISSGSWPLGFELSGHTFPIVDKDGLIYIPLVIFGSPAQVRLFAFDGSGAARWTFDVLSSLNIVSVGGSALNDDGTLYLLAQGMLFGL